MKHQVAISNNTKKYMVIWLMLVAMALTTILSTSTVYGANWENIPDSAGLPSGKYITLSAEDAKITWNTSADHKVVKYYTNASGKNDGNLRKALMVKLKNSTSSASTYSGTICTIKWSKAAKIGEKYVDITMKVKDLKISAAHSTYGMRDDNYVTFAYITPYTLWMHAADSTPGYYAAARNCELETKITWAGTNDVVDLSFYQGVMDIDKGYGTGYFREGWKAVSGYTRPWYYWKDDYNYKIDGAKVYDNSDKDCDTITQEWKRGGLIAPTSKGSFTSCYYGGICGTGVYIFNQYKDIGGPTKTVNDSTVQKGSTITWTISQEVGTYYKNVFAPYKSLKFTDKLATGLEYVSAEVISTDGTTIATDTSGAWYNSSTRTVTYSVPSKYLNDEDFYNGKKVKMKIKTKITASSGKISNTAITNFGDGDFEEGETIDVEEPVLTLTKTANVTSCEYKDDVKFTVKVTQTEDGIYGKNVVVSDSLPTGMTLNGTPTLSNAEGTVTTASDGKSWSVKIPKLSADTTATIKFNVKVDTSSNTSITSITNTAKATCDNVVEDVSASDTVSIKYPSLTIAKVAGGEEFVNGDVASWTVTVKPSNSTARSVEISDTLPTGLTLTEAPALTGVSDTTATVTYTDSKWAVTIPTLAKSETAKITFKTKINTSVTSLTNNASVTGETMTSKTASDTISIVSTPPELTQVKVVKKWSDSNNSKGVRPETVTVNLLQNGSTYKSVELSEDNNWNYTFANLPKNNSSGTAYTYTVSEEDVDNYTSSSAKTTGDYDTWTITNTVDALVDVDISKEWSDSNNVDNSRPSDISVQLLRNGTAIETITLSKANNWHYTFENLPKNDSSGTAYTYTATETEVPDLYKASYSISTNGDTRSISIVNTYIGSVTVSGQKEWDDNNNAYSTRPSSITVNLLRDGTVVDTKTVTADDNWKFTFTDLPKYSDSGAAYTYTVKEATVSGYTTEYDYTYVDEGEE